jgi:hypothetical protein
MLGLGVKSDTKYGGSRDLSVHDLFTAGSNTNDLLFIVRSEAEVAIVLVARRAMMRRHPVDVKVGMKRWKCKSIRSSKALITVLPKVVWYSMSSGLTRPQQLALANPLNNKVLY